MKFTPETEEEIQSNQLIKEGKYKAKVFDANDKDKYGNPLITKSGIEKIDIMLKIFIDDDSFRILTTTITPAFKKLLKHFCEASGMEDKYIEGNLNADHCKDCYKEFIVDIARRKYVNDKGIDVYVNNVIDYLKIENDKFIEDELIF